MRFNICPTIHFSRVPGKSQEGLDALLDTIQDARSPPVVDPRLTDVISQIEDRIKAWYELLFNLDRRIEDQVLGDFLKDIHDYTRDTLQQRRISLENAKISSTGSRRLDDLKGQILLFTGFAMLSEIWPRCSKLDLWDEPEQLLDGRYSGNFTVIRKREDLIVHIRKERNQVFARANRPERVVKDKVRKLVFDSVDFEQVRVPDGKVTGLGYVKGNRVMFLLGDDGRVRYMDLPNVSIRQSHSRKVNREWPSFMESWLTRASFSKADISSMANEMETGSKWEGCVKSILISCKTLSDSKGLVQLQERMAAAPIHHQPHVANLAHLLELAEQLDPGDMPLEEMAEDFFRDFGQDYYLEDAGLEAFSLESSYTTLELNKSLRSLTATFEALMKVDKSFLAGGLYSMVDFMDELNL
jgi:hypothetical protein